MSRALNIARFGIKAACRIPKPSMARLNLALTWHCNHRCSFCNIWQNQAGSPELTYRDVHELITQNKIIWLGISGGEPTLNRHYPMILNLCVDRLPLTNVITNGEFPELIYDTAKEALQKSDDNLLIIHVSLLGSEKVHDKMVGMEGSYQNVLRTIERLKYLDKNRAIIGIEHMTGKDNMGEWTHVSRLVKEFKIGVTYTTEYRSGYYHNDGQELENNIPAPIPDTRFVPIDYFKNVVLSRAAKKKLFKCVAGEYSCFITPDKVVYPCFFSIPDKPAFKIKDDYVLDGMFGSVEEYIKNCKGCFIPCEAYQSLIFRPWRAFNG